MAKDLESLEVQLWIDGLSKGLRSKIRTQAQARHGTAEQAVGAARPRRCPHATWPRLRGTEPSGKAFEEITTTEFTFASAWPVRGSASPANPRAAAVRVGAVLLFFQA